MSEGSKRRNANYRERNRERLREKAKEYYHKKATAAQKAKWVENAKIRYHADIEKSREENRSYYAANREERCAYERAYNKQRWREQREHMAALEVAAYYRNRDQKLRVAKRFRERHRERLRAECRARNKKDVENLADWYVSMLLDGCKDQELIETKRVQVKIRRIVNENRNSR